MKTVYIETSIISYLTARPSRDLVVAANQESTRDWWDGHRNNFALYISPLVLDEAGQGDAEAAGRRLKALEAFKMVEVIDQAGELAEALLREAALPSKAQDDAAHIALAAVHHMDYLLTWNCRHINNAEKKPLIREVCVKLGYVCPEICTPVELMGGTDDE